MLEQLCTNTVKEYLRSALANPVLEDPHGRSVRDIDRIGQAAESLVAHPNKQLVLHLFVREVVQALQHQNAHHRLGWIRRAAALRADRTRRHPIDFRCKCCKVDVRFDLGQRVAQRIDHLPGPRTGERATRAAQRVRGWGGKKNIR